jgi:hypothetical protein
MSFHVIYEDPDYYDEESFDEWDEIDEDVVSLDDIDPDSVSYDPFDTMNS